MKRNIGIFTHDLYPYKPWGQGRYVHDLVRHLRHLHESCIYVFSPSPGMGDPYHIEIFKGSHQTAGKNLTFSFKLSFEIDRLIRKYELGLVHFQGGPGGMLLLGKPSVPLVYTVHHTYYQQSKYITSQKWKKLLYPWEKYGYKRSDFLICVSASTREVLLKEYGIEKTRCRVIPNGVDGEHFHETGTPRIPHSLFFIGRLEERKGVDFLLRSIPRVKESLRDVRLYIAGRGRLELELRKIVRDSRLDENVELLGVLDDREVNDWYNKVSLVVIPSVFEGFGLTVIEAMACGTPVIATNVDGLRDVVRNPNMGRLVDYNDVRGLSDAIISLLKNDEERRSLASQVAAEVRTKYDWQIVAAQVFETYEAVLTR